MTTSRGVYYFASPDEARTFAEKIGAPTDRIVEYLLGFAIQFHKSGPYVGPGNLTHAGCQFCEGGK